ncbi:5-methylcytosine restriction system specificity protein McrC [Scopulibacillus darangshiensis]|uniref:5-methylcytosine restriction system specificity protein McrC n=1 Tax=Scopulibacillus darangshiensis TaxID=442528 RepID=UPI001404AA9B|nr:hypothetical protein [Scopulibacillus darangshiensis]
MRSLKQVPVKNFYYMLMYAFRYPLDQFQEVIQTKEPTSPIDLWAMLFNREVGRLIRQGLVKEYQPVKEETGTIRGKIQFPESIQHQSFYRAKMVCEWDEMDANVTANRVLKSTLERILNDNSVGKEIQLESSRLLTYLLDIPSIELTNRTFQSLNVKGRYKAYHLAFYLSEMIAADAFIEKGQSQNRLDTIDESKNLGNLFEDFVREFYRLHLPGFSIGSETFTWGNHPMLPKMITDISMKSANRYIIMDTKYYVSALSQQFDVEKLRSAHLYQLNAYLQHAKLMAGAEMTIEGVLLYPKVDKGFDETFELLGHKVRVCTLDLTASWRRIEERLMTVVSGCI